MIDKRITPDDRAARLVKRNADGSGPIPPPSLAQPQLWLPHQRCRLRRLDLATGGGELLEKPRHAAWAVRRVDLFKEHPGDVPIMLKTAPKHGAFDQGGVTRFRMYHQTTIWAIK